MLAETFDGLFAHVRFHGRMQYDHCTVNMGASAPRLGGWRGRLMLLAGAAMALAPALAMAAGPPDFPASTSTEDVTKWAASATSIKPGAILAMTPQLVAALDKAQPAGEGLVVATMREELIDKSFAARAEGRSLTTNIEFNCPGRQFRFMGEVTYPQPNLQGAPRYTEQAEGWYAVVDGGIIGKLFNTVCANPAVVPVSAPAPQAAPPAVVATAPVAAAPAKPAVAVATAAPPAAPQAAPTKQLVAVAVVAASAPHAATAPAPASAPSAAAAKPPAALASAAPPAAAAHAEAPPPAHTPALRQLAEAAAAPAKVPALAGPPRPSRPGPYLVLAGAFSIPSNAQAKAAALGHHGGGHVTVTPFTAGARKLYLVQVSGFSDHAAASAFCSTVSRSPADCIVRLGRRRG
jgi:hypothetical protein